jgi:hypothetical protein
LEFTMRAGRSPPSRTLEMRELFFEHHITIKVAHRPGRNEPRANKRRPKILQLLTKPRHEAKAELESAM